MSQSGCPYDIFLKCAPSVHYLLLCVLDARRCFTHTLVQHALSFFEHTDYICIKLAIIQSMIQVSQCVVAIGARSHMTSWKKCSFCSFIFCFVFLNARRHFSHTLPPDSGTLIRYLGISWINCILCISSNLKKASARMQLLKGMPNAHDTRRRQKLHGASIAIAKTPSCVEACWA